MARVPEHGAAGCYPAAAVIRRRRRHPRLAEPSRRRRSLSPTVRFAESRRKIGNDRQHEGSDDCLRRCVIAFTAVALGLARRLRDQQRADPGGAGEIRLERGAEPVPAPGRPHPEPRRDREGLRPAGARGADPGHGSARPGRARSRSMPRRSPIRRSSASSRRRRTSSPAPSAACSSRSSAIRS